MTSLSFEITFEYCGRCLRVIRHEVREELTDDGVKVRRCYCDGCGRHQWTQRWGDNRKHTA